MNIYKKDDKIIVEIDYWQDQYNPYMGDEPIGRLQNVVGVISGNECTISHLIDIDYKDKPPQEGMPIVYFYGEPEKFRELCKELGLLVWEHDICKKCNKPIYGSFTLNDKLEPICYSCELDIEKSKD
jgi:hypothetical protein